MKRKFKVRFHLGKENNGQNFMKWRVENLETGDVVFYDPEVYYITMLDARLYNQKATAKKIFDGQNKTVCAWVRSEDCIVEKFELLEVEDNRISYNPRVKPNWMDASGNNIDNTTHEVIYSNGRKLFAN